MTLSILQNAQRVVIKLGSALIVDKATGRPRHDWLRSLASDIAVLKSDGKQVLIVSSGAAALGRAVIGNTSPVGSLESKQAASAIGQPRLMSALSDAFSPFQQDVAQSLLTPDDTENRRRWLNARATLFHLFDHDIIPIINENDTVATDELRYGDNDRLAARVAQMVGADVLILLSDIDGLYTADPRSHPDAEHIASIDQVSDEIRRYAGDANTQAGVGTGGMVTKLDAAEIAWNAGCSTVITLGHEHHPIKGLTDGGRATWIVAPKSPHDARLSWLSGHLNPEGVAVCVDEGAERALLGGASLLPVGIKSVTGDFMRGAAIAIENAAGTVIAKGFSAYGSIEIDQIKGLQSSDVAERLGYPARKAVIHRDDMVLVSTEGQTS